ncbi:MAG: hypothetical protein ACD_22C00224G0002 [uncultured bacterium]|nr:MAG: hypothetical protein ACD_22C00224G0002 [uncultured bacterium]
MTTISIVLKAVRWNEWKDTKLVFFLIFFATYCPKTNIFYSVYELILGIIFVSICLSLGHITNNISDTDQDKQAGKQIIKPEVLKIILVILIILLFVFSIHYITDLISLIIILFSLFLGISYSKRPFRFKEKGLLGIIVGGISQRVLPLLPIAYCWHAIPSAWLFFLVLTFISFRQMIVHQIKDHQKDLHSHTNTFVTNIGISTSKIIIYALSLIEISALIIWLVNLNTVLPLITFLMFLVFLVASYTQKSTYWQKISILNSSRYPLSDFYFLLLPILGCLFISPPLTYIYLILAIVFQKYFLFEFAYIFRR